MYCKLLRILSIFSVIFLTSCFGGSQDEANTDDVVAAKPVMMTKGAKIPSPGLDQAAENQKKQPAKKMTCDRPPEAVICCEALIPSCNECRARAKAAMDAWRKECAPKQNELCKKPPTADCCTEATAACRSCRDEALTKMMAWREACGAKPQVNCMVKPSPDQCCATAEPSCQACRKCMTKLLEEYDQYCKKK